MNRLKSKIYLHAHFPFVLIGLILVARGYVSVFRAELWAEDASELFPTALNLGLKSLITPLCGYHFLIARVFALFANLFPVFWTPTLYVVMSITVSTLTLGLFTTEGFSWLIPSQLHRTLLCLVLALGPGSAEVFYNLINMSSVLTFLFLLLLIEKPFQLGLLKMLTLIFIITSSGQTFIFAPLLIYFWYKTRKPNYLWVLFTFIPIMALNVMGTHEAGNQAGTLALQNFPLIPRILKEQFFLRLWIGPWLAPAWTDHFARIPATLFWLGCGLMPLLWSSVYIMAKKPLQPFTSLDKKDREKWEILAIAYLCSLGIYPVIALTRSYALAELLRESGHALWFMRYSYLPGAIALIFWATFFLSDRLIAKVVSKICLLLLMAQVIVSCFWNGGVVYHRPDLHWPEDAKKIQNALIARSEGKIKSPTEILKLKYHPDRSFPLVINP